MSTQTTARLRVCASCEWVFSRDDASMCPKCGFAHYGAHYVYGNKAYTYRRTQQPWIDRKVADYTYKLQKEASQQ